MIGTSKTGLRTPLMSAIGTLGDIGLCVAHVYFNPKRTFAVFRAPRLKSAFL